MQKSVLIMGGSYFIGKKIVDVMLEKGYCVYTLNRGTKKEVDFRIKHIKCDRNNAEEMRIKLCNLSFDIIIDVSALNREQLEILMDSINCKEIEKFIFISSSAVYDVENISIPYSEDDEINENKYWTFYGKNKIEAEKYLIEKFTQIDTKLSIIRPPYVYGENNYAPRETFIFEHIENDKPIIIPNIGDTKLQFIYTDDLANIISELIERDDLSISVYNVGNKQYLTIKEWIKVCEEVVGKKANIVEYNYKENMTNVREFFPFFDYDNVLNVSKINEIVDKETDIFVGLKRTYSWYLENKQNIVFKEEIQENEKRILDKLKISIK